MEVLQKEHLPAPQVSRGAAQFCPLKENMDFFFNQTLIFIPYSKLIVQKKKAGTEL